MSRLHADRGEGPWADADALHDGIDYAKLARLWKRQGQLTAEPQSTQRTTTVSPAVTTTATLPLPDSQPLPFSSAASANLRVLCGKKLRCLEEQALRLLHWGLISEKRSERRLARQIMRQWLRVDDSGEVVFWRKLPKKRRPKPARKKPSWRERRQAARRAGRPRPAAAAHRRREDRRRRPPRSRQATKRRNRLLWLCAFVAWGEDHER